MTASVRQPGLAGGRLIVLSSGMKRISTLSGLLPEFTLVFGVPASIEATDRVIAWGMRPSAEKARQYARRHGLAVLHVEDGLLRSVGLGASGPPLSLMIDDQALYLDSAGPSRLERLISSGLSTDQRERADELIQSWRHERVSKYNHQRDDIDADLARPFVLVVDQTFGDASIQAGDADEDSFQRMLDAALEENPDCQIFLKVHPDVVAGKKRGHFDLSAVGRMARVRVIADGCHPALLLEHARAIYAVTSQLGFEGLLWGKPVRLFGMPFYAGWGLTQDTLPAPARRAPVPLAQLVHAVLIAYPRYVDPESGSPCEVERVLVWMGLQRRMRARFQPLLHAYGFSKWKKPFVRDFFDGSTVRFVRRLPKADTFTVAFWGRKNDARLIKKNGALPSKLIRIEDGFLRSVGLGADLIRPLSWVQDSIGIYYDATQPSALEVLLQAGVTTQSVLSRAHLLRQRILVAGLTKYNVGNQHAWSRPAGASTVILIPGQVESDASIRYGAAHIRRNIDLVKAVRDAHPAAHILYKPHPDVLAKLREVGQGEGDARNWCDEVLGDVSMHMLFDQVDEIHTLTSLTGFEALLRGKKVVTYGQPFYAGWGLTTDIALSDEVYARRGRDLTLDELVAATLILYPTYVSRRTRKFTTPENALDELIAWRAEPPRMPRIRRWIAYLTRKI